MKPDVIRPVLRPGGHALCWHLVLALILASAVLAHRVATGLLAGNVDGAALGVLAASLLLLLAVFGVWSRYLFLLADLRRLLVAAGGKELGLRQRWRSARVGALWLFVRFDNPWLDHVPVYLHRLDRSLARLLPFLDRHWPGKGGPRGHLTEQGEASVFQLGRFEELAGLRLEIDSSFRNAAPVTADLDPDLDRALRRAAESWNDEGAGLVVEITESWLRVSVRGGTWLGDRFRRRIEEALEFTRRLAEGLSSRFVALDPEQWSIQPEEQDFAVRPIASGETRPGCSAMCWATASPMLMLLAATPSWASVDGGVGFLVASQELDGSWQSTQVRTEHATAAALRALLGVAQAPAARSAAADFLEAASVADTDDRAKRIAVLVPEGRTVTALVAQALADAHAGGGWGLTARFSADSIDTSLALIALAQADQTGTKEAFLGLVSLVGLQNADGGWSCVGFGESNVACTAQAVLALSLYRRLFLIDAQIEAAVNFLLAQLQADGSIGAPSDDSVFSTAIAAQALLAAGNELPGVRALIQDFLEAAQAVDGSWDGDPFLTAEVVIALQAFLTTPRCGDGLVNKLGEACDGFDLAGAACEDVGFGPGDLACDATCNYDTAGCSPAPVCGDGTVNRLEEACDGLDLSGETCASLGFEGGDLACSDVCTFDTSVCTVPPVCGDGIVNQASEACDGADLTGQSCESLGLGTGTLACTFSCRFDTAGCSAPPICGDGVLNGATERCDGQDLAGLTCESFGGSGGPFACLSNCANFDVTGCTDLPDADMDGFPAGADCDDADPEVNPGQEEIPLNLKDDDCDLRTPDVLVECSVEVVFTMDTSGSMFDDAAALCSRISQVESDLAALGIDAQTHLLGISGTRGGSFSCLTDHVLNLLGGTVPGDDGACDGFLNQSESWGQATAIVADRFPWTPGAIRVIVPISDEGPCNGNICFVTGSDRDAIANGAAIAAANEIFVSPIVAQGGNSCVSNLATLAADETGGRVFFSTNPDLDLAGAIADLLIGACEETLVAEITPADAVNPVSTSHPFTATVTDALGFPLEGREISAVIISGPNAGALGSATTGANGSAGFEYTSAGAVGVDEIVASVVDSRGRTVESAPALKFWDEDCNENGIADTCDLDCGGFETRCGAVMGCGMSIDVNGDDSPDECLLPDAGTDEDEDGSPASVDCDDTNPDVNPGAQEIPGNGIDDDCNPATPDEVSDGVVSCDLTADRISYDVTDTVVLQGSLENSDELLSLSGLVASMLVHDSLGVSVFEETRELAPLVPGARAEEDFSFTAGGNLPGDFQAHLTISAGGELAAECSAGFAISSSADTGAGLSGTLSFDPEVVNAGDSSDVIYSVSNGGNATLADLGIKVVIVDPRTEEVMDELFDSTTLAEGGTFGADQPFSTEGLPVGDYIGVLHGVLASSEEVTLDDAVLTILERAIIIEPFESFDVELDEDDDSSDYDSSDDDSSDDDHGNAGKREDEFEVEGTFTLGSGSDGIDPLSEDVTLKVGTFSITIPAGDFELEDGDFEFEGTIGGAELELEIKPLGGSSFEFEAEAEGVDLNGTVTPVEVMLTIGNDTGTTTVFAEFDDDDDSSDDSSSDDDSSDDDSS